MPTYSFADVTASISGPGGSFNFGAGSGVAEEGISAEFSEDKNVMNIGADGHGMNTLRAAKNGTITVRLQKTSSTNAKFSQLYAFQQHSSANWGKNTIRVADPVRGDVVTGVEGAFKKHTGMTWAKDGNMNEWAFDVVSLDILAGAGVPDVNA